ELTAEDVNLIREHVTAACEKCMADLTLDRASRLPLIQGRLERNKEGRLVQMPLKLRQYLCVPAPAHRKAITRLFLSSHALGIEILRYTERYRDPTPRQFRFCRFCRRAVESESHALLGCMSEGSLIELRRDFLIDVYKLAPDLPHTWASVDDCLLRLAQSRNFDLIKRVAKYTYEVFKIYSTQDVFKPAEYLYNVLE
ncbi:hypothetical protein FB451DRAFT_1014936, partial [Mycena latifolia]